MTRLHADQIDTSVALARRLVGDQCPAWADLLVRRAQLRAVLDDAGA